MHTIRLKVSDKVYDKILRILSKFSKHEIEILSETDNYNTTKDYLEKELDEISSGKATYHTIEELDEKLENVINKNED